MKKMVFYRSPELLKQILGGKERELSSFELTIPFGGPAEGFPGVWRYPCSWLR